MLKSLLNWLISLFSKRKPQVNPDILQGEINELKKQNETINKEIDAKKSESNSTSEIEDYFNKKN